MASVYSAAAQTQFGLRAGLNTVNFVNSEIFDFDARLRFVGGAFARLPVSAAFAVQPEVLYSQKGARISGAGGQPDIDYSIDYLEVPVLARVALPLSRLLDVGVVLGPAVGIPLRDDIEIENVEVMESLNTRTDVGLKLGADVGAGPFAVDLRYTFGLINPLAEPDPPAMQGFDVRNGAFAATFAYLFGR